MTHRAADQAAVLRVLAQQVAAQEHDVVVGRLTRLSTRLVVVTGPAGAGATTISGWLSASLSEQGVTASRHDADELLSLAPRDNLLIVDLQANRPGFRDVLAMADEAVLVAGPDPSSLLKTYIILKTAQPKENTLFSLIVNRAPDQWTAEDVHQRLDQSCRRFLRRSVRLLGHVGADQQIGQAPDPQRAGLAKAGLALRGDIKRQLDQIVRRMMNQDSAVSKAA